MFDPFELRDRVKVSYGNDKFDRSGMIIELSTFEANKYKIPYAAVKLDDGTIDTFTIGHLLKDV